MKKVYVAGPDVFRNDYMTYVNEVKMLLTSHNLQGLFPTDTCVPKEITENAEIADFIYHSNIKLINQCDAVLANMSPFRGPSMDIGTGFEIGYAAALKKPIFGFSCMPKFYSDLKHCDYFSRVKKFQKVKENIDEYGIESFGLSDNLMVICSTKIYQTIESAIKGLSEYYIT